MSLGKSAKERLPIIEYLFSVGLDPNKRADELGHRHEQPLRYVDRAVLTSLVKCLLEASAGQYLKDRFDSSLLDLAVRAKDEYLVTEYTKYRKQGIPDPVKDVRRKREPIQ
ncbi:hypothetical protein CC78DRAFT_150171 [Lojkania enalia]|uniref:Ankyrin repeat protein n=1 Tax=Lojkania enalia TaxID=147567 RepID=A0A9P4JYK3_9PLEO|nr:hypothetical protein CC78DRAFT_150171 [Didymosphaeria enalia]